jgi:predicted nucleotidyltransferase
MKQRIALTPEESAIVRAILQKHLPGRSISVFGSRATGREKPTSDLDLCIMDGPPIDDVDLDALWAEFATSSLPFSVDVVQLSKLRPPFRDIVLAQAVPLSYEQNPVLPPEADRAA